ncbi:hypothetical protein AD998_06520 [bacterium 336/3]|nr:hypothetical protein AD998_06520 [bacterium 336/3]
MKKLILTLLFILSTNLVYSQKNGFLLDSLVMWESFGKKDTVFSSVLFTDKNETRSIGFSIRFGLMRKANNNALSIAIKIVGDNMCMQYNERINFLLLDRKNITLANKKDSNCNGELIVFFSKSMKNLDKLEWVIDSELGAISTGHEKPTIYIPIKPNLKKDLNRVLHFLAKKLQSYEE